MTTTDLDRWAADQAAYGSPDYVRGYRDGIDDTVQAAKDLGESRPALAWVILWRAWPDRPLRDDGTVYTDEMLAREAFADQACRFPEMEQYLCAASAVTP